MITVPSEARTSTQEVLPPKRAVLGPGAAIDPRVPQKRTCMADSLIIPCRPRRISSTNSGGLGSPMPSEGGRTPGLESRRAPGPRTPPPPLPSAGPSDKQQRVTAALPRIPTHVMGSHGFPGWFWTALDRIKAGDYGQTDQKETFDDATQLAIRDQERAGLDIVCDGEMRRYWDFVPAINAELRALVEVGADYIQIDEPSAAIVPGQIDEYVKMFNACVEGVRARIAYHVCFGNLLSRPRGKRSYRWMFPAL